MDSLPVTLIVKAPNQQIEDQKIKCDTSWTINKLKEHLAEVYPSKPPRHEQKLIYSGQLLSDSLVLKDVLRHYEGQDTHTVHLVCTPKHMTMNRPKQSTPVAENSNNTVTSSTTNTNPATTGNVSPETTTQNPNVLPQNTTNSSRLSSAHPINGLPNNGFPWMNVNGQVPHIDLNNLSQYQLHMAYMQQAYMQYMAQYMQLASGQAPTIPPSNIFTTPNIPANEPNAQPNQPEPAAQPNAAVQPQQENEERDWLDVFYMLSRAMVLFSVVYFYSSPVRFIFVLFLGIALYLYQTGFFRNININNNNINGTPNGIQEEEQAPTRFMVAWTFIATFFASLIPEIPNINA